VTRRSSKPSTRAASELEGVVLGHLWKHGSCTAYSVRKEMLDSPSSHWSGSAGAIYPLLARLERQGLVLSRRAALGRRDASAYELTPLGTRRFLSWLGPPFDRDVVSIAVDPLRTRIHFLGALGSRGRSAFFARARAELERHLGDLMVAPAADTFDLLSRSGALRLTRARIAWLAEVERALSRREASKRARPRAGRRRS
jgi:DNA-binding PadR family transcriptional regulator